MSCHDLSAYVQTLLALWERGWDEDSYDEHDPQVRHCRAVAFTLAELTGSSPQHLRVQKIRVILDRSLLRAVTFQSAPPLSNLQVGLFWTCSLIWPAPSEPLPVGYPVLKTLDRACVGQFAWKIAAGYARQANWVRCLPLRISRVSLFARKFALWTECPDVVKIK